MTGGDTMHRSAQGEGAQGDGVKGSRAEGTHTAHDDLHVHAPTRIPLLHVDSNTPYAPRATHDVRTRTTLATLTTSTTHPFSRLYGKYCLVLTARPRKFHGIPHKPQCGRAGYGKSTYDP